MRDLSSSTLSPVLTLAPGESATRACAVESQDIVSQVITKATIERETLISRAIGELNRPLGKDVRGDAWNRGG